MNATKALKNLPDIVERLEFSVPVLLRNGIPAAFAIENLLDDLRKAAAALTDYRTRTGIDVGDVVAKLSAGTHVLTKAEPKFTYGHCEHKKQPRGCQLNNVQCNYPDCDRKPMIRAAQDNAT